MKPSSSTSITLDVFEQRENKRRSLFSHTWEEFIPKVFEDVPKYYRPGNIVASLGLWELWVWQFIQTIKLRPGYKALDVCAGTNDVGVRLLQKQPDIAMTAIDRSKEMQAQGQVRAAKYQVKITSIVQDVHTLPFPDSSFNVITLQAASRHLQLDKVLPEILRVLKPGGHFYHCDMLKPSTPMVEWAYLRFLRMSVAWTALVFGSTSTSRNCGEYFKDAIEHFYTPEELTDVFKLVGFDKVACRKSIWGGMVGYHDCHKAA